MAGVKAADAAVRIRRYVPSDHPRVYRIWKVSGLGVTPSDTSAEVERIRRRDPELFLVAERGTSLVGAVLGRFDGRRGWVVHLAVDPGARHARVGTALMSEVERRLARKGCPKINLLVLPTNAGVVRFYRRLGYAPRRMILMEKWLASSGAPRRPSAGARAPPRRPQGRPRRRRSGAHPPRREDPPS